MYFGKIRYPKYMFLGKSIPSIIISKQYHHDLQKLYKMKKEIKAKKLEEQYQNDKKK